ncbi:HAMP domain-containing sensor histidine kinase [Breoghania sp. L-A4]|uniref:HAMP domain-containing sensor histidine kinase n=1 Tax=Breoghania sp. L-A4 TaxID=2304600 RepID=UPI000E3606B7|nr:HAMP domain-containing sensor histidine kinase [Breoghania sp. L-A4]AXS40087.1 sensor histidine kinase [Breoghania sp. L-A4]
MQRLFWKFFIIIWLAMLASIAVLFAASSFFQITPLASEIQRGQQTFALDVAMRLLTHEGENAAIAFAIQAANAQKSVKLTVAKQEASAGCEIKTQGYQRTVERNGACYSIVLHAHEQGFVSATWPRLVPWLSALLAAAIAAFWLAQYLVRPVGYLRSGLSALARGRFDMRIGDKMNGRKDEVAALAYDFDTSAARLEQLHKTQQRLFHDVSHELRSPLSRLQAAVGVLQQNPAKLDVVMERMVREVERIDGLIDEILTLARLVDGSRDAIELQTLDVIELLNDIVADAAFEAQARKIAVTHQGAQSFVAQVNGELIYRALENVIRNAVKYTSDRAKVSIRSQVKDDRLHILVVDEGPGVAESDLERIFQPFSRGEDANVLNGYGLGLAITKHAIERHGGAISATNADGAGLAVAMDIARSTH